MHSAIWIIGSLAYMVIYSGINAMEGTYWRSWRPHSISGPATNDFKGLATRLCNTCVAGTSDNCDGHNVIMVCPKDSPYCATSATAPDFRSTLKCVSYGEAPCVLTKTMDQALEIICVCNIPTCNMHFPSELRNLLLNYTATNNDEHILLEKLVKLLPVVNASEIMIKNLTIYPTTEVIIDDDHSSDLMIPVNTETDANNTMFPRADALKQVPTMPSEDDEDEGDTDGEGSGSYDDHRTVNLSTPAPSSPSTVLPESGAPPLFTYFMIAAPILIYIIG